jgi:hypothetical protein
MARCGVSGSRIVCVATGAHEVVGLGLSGRTCMVDGPPARFRTRPFIGPRCKGAIHVSEKAACRESGTCLTINKLKFSSIGGRASWCRRHLLSGAGCRARPTSRGSVVRRLFAACAVLSSVHPYLTVRKHRADSCLTALRLARHVDHNNFSATDLSAQLCAVAEHMIVTCFPLKLFTKVY